MKKEKECFFLLLWVVFWFHPLERSHRDDHNQSEIRIRCFLRGRRLFAIPLDVRAAI